MISPARILELNPSRLRATAEWRFLDSLTRAGRELSVAWWALIVVQGLLPPAFTLAVGNLVGAVQRGRSVGQALAIAGLVFVAMNALGPVQTAVAAQLGARAAVWLSSRILRACVGPAGLRHLEDPDLADKLTRARSFETGMGGPMLMVSVPPIGDGIAQIVAGVAQAAILSRYTWWAPLLLGAAWFSTHFLLRRNSISEVRGLDSIVQAERHAAYAYRLAVDSNAAKEIRVFGLADWVVDRFATHKRAVVDLFFQERRLREGPVRWALAAIVISNGIFFLSLGHDALTGAVGLSAVVVFAQAAAGVSSLGYSVFDWWLQSAAESVPAVLDLGGHMASAGALPSGGRPAGALPAAEIRFRDVRFGYGDAAPRVLDGLDLRIPAGSSLAIVGVNGAGKTTLAKLLCRLYDPQQGAVLVDGTDLRELDVDAWRVRIAAVFQDFIRYELPLRDNVAPTGADDDQVAHALRTAGADGVAGVETILSRAYEDGTDLSGGQWQRVALARALCSVGRGAGVVILDEPTAQLDVRAEAEIFDRVLAAARGCTTILISHRFSTVRHADRICVLEGGRVVELGSHEELMALGGRYRQMFDLQAARFAEEDGNGGSV